MIMNLARFHSAFREGKNVVKYEWIRDGTEITKRDYTRHKSNR